jgi:beta-ketoacyl synthase-like protein
MSIRVVAGAVHPGATGTGPGSGATGTVGDHLAVLARVSWPQRPGDTLTPIPAFVGSSFSPLVAEVAERCLRAHYGQPPAPPERAERTAIVLATRFGDIGTGEAVARALAEDRRVPPLLFFQSNINAVVGHVAARWGLAGPVVCTSPLGDPLADGLLCAALLLADGEAAEALVVAVDQAHAGAPDHGAAVLVAAQVQEPGAPEDGSGQQPLGGGA